jgi:hypothetical protein
MIDEKESFIQRIETLSEIARNTEMQSRRLFREVERMFEEYRKRWPEKPAEGTEHAIQPDNSASPVAG